MPETAPVDIQVESQYLPDQSEPTQQRFAFAYTITIQNTGDEAVRLLNRHWIITDGDNQVQEVQGEGVIGKQPLIPPGESFSYTSGAVIDTAVGTMEGSYEMISASGRPFIAPIGIFSLAQPSALH
ncbi:Protein ApaG [Zhongshania aliphaticivorans]|uniref:Protein ApaG n=1 Tax=Zhongshania aliphaticivorans TaxID=1470434 RepID=A0A5S9Q5L8_9GAMM|nr:Co2+/Mg2+ efflux protein ApaG [Zhongshania aliphaticivorans]CAA0095155.1 Protein ApaG [Zhongshania aliphaticivorans]CAA0112939.1 Protein ApaG [Zhongshania aliphaticivorans]